MDVLVDKSYRNYDGYSRYTNFPYYYHTVDNKYVYGTTAHLKDSTPYIIHIVEQNDTLDIISLKYYNNPTYYWVIADFNRIRDPYISLKIGDRIKVPTFSAIEFEE